MVDSNSKDLQQKLNKLKKSFELRQGEITKTLAEDDSIYHPEVLSRLIWELRSITKILIWFEEEEDG